MLLIAMSPSPSWDDDHTSELRKFVMPEFVFGVGALEMIGHHAAHLGARNLLLVTDQGVTSAGWTDKVLKSLIAANLRYEVFANVTPNPCVDEVTAGAETYRAAGCDSMVALGGGSSIDCAKGIGMVVSNHRPVVEFEGVDRIAVSLPPLICIPTTAGSAADVSQFAILSHPQQHRKLTFISKALVPDLSLVDPACLTTLDDYQRAITGVDVLVHAIEAFVSTGSSAITDLHALEAIRLIKRYLVEFVTQTGDEAVYRGMAQACLLAGLAFSNASLGAVHAMSHAICGYLDLSHGECNALLLEHVIDFNFHTVPQRYRHVAAILGIKVDDLSERAVNASLRAALHSLRHQIGIKGSLKDAGIVGADIPKFARDAMFVPCIVTNPRKPNRRDIETIYEHAL